MASIGKLLSTKIGDFIIGVIQKRIGFTIEPYFFAPSGVDSVPLPNDKMLIDKKDGTGVHVIIGSLMISQGAKEGELILYSRDSDGAIKSKISLLNDGSINMESIDSSKKMTMIFGSTTIEFSVSGMKITAGGVTYNSLTHLHPTGVGPSGPPTPNT